MGVFGNKDKDDKGDSTPASDKSNATAQENANSPSSAGQANKNAVDPGSDIQPGVIPSDATRDEQEGERDPGTGSVNDPTKQAIAGATSSFQTSSVGSGTDNTNAYHTGGPDDAGKYNDDAGSGPTVGTPNAPSSDGPDDGEVRPEQEGGVQAEPATTSEPNPDYVASGEADIDNQPVTDTGGVPAEPASDEEAEKIKAANAGETTTTPNDGKNDDKAGAQAARGGNK